MDNYYNVEHVIDQVLGTLYNEKGLKTILIGLLSDVNRFISHKPTLIALGGIPGVGKSTYSIKYYKDKFFIINPDDYRQFYPNYSSLNTSSLIVETNELSTKISELLFKVLIKLSCNIVIECTFANYKYWQEFLKSDNVYLGKYSKILIYLSAPLDVCYQSMCCRYKTESQNMKGIIPRPVAKDFLYDRASRIEESVAKYVASNLFNEIIFMYKDTMRSEFVQISYNEYLVLINEYKTRYNEII